MSNQPESSRRGRDWRKAPLALKQQFGTAVANDSESAEALRLWRLLVDDPGASLREHFDAVPDSERNV